MNDLEMSQVYRTNCALQEAVSKCTHTYAPINVYVCMYVCAHITYRQRIYFPHLFFLWYYYYYYYYYCYYYFGGFWFIFRILTKRCFKFMAWRTLDVNLSTLWCWLTDFSGTYVMLSIFLREFCLMLDHCSEGCWYYWNHTNGNKMHVLQV